MPPTPTAAALLLLAAGLALGCAAALATGRSPAAPAATAPVLGHYDPLPR